MPIFYRVVIDVPVDVPWLPGMELPVHGTACLLIDGIESEPRVEGWMNVDGVADREGDMIPDLTPLAGELLGKLIS